MHAIAQRGVHIILVYVHELDGGSGWCAVGGVLWVVAVVQWTCSAVWCGVMCWV